MKLKHESLNKTLFAFARERLNSTGTPPTDRPTPYIHIQIASSIRKVKSGFNSVALRTRDANDWIETVDIPFALTQKGVTFRRTWHEIQCWC